MVLVAIALVFAAALLGFVVGYVHRERTWLRAAHRGRQVHSYGGQFFAVRDGDVPLARLVLRHCMDTAEADALAAISDTVPK